MTRFRLRVTLLDSEPSIWREFDADGRLRLSDLHDALQIMMGWRESHLHMFTDTKPYSRDERGRRWENPDSPDADDDVLSEYDFSIDDVLGAIDTLWYEYDFGDSWTHRLDVLERGADEPLLAPFVLVDGENRGPFEDSGGTHGYAEKLEILADPQHPEHDDITRWVRAVIGPWFPQHPGSFDLVGVQSELNLRFNPEASGYLPGDLSGIVKDDRLRHHGDVVEASPIATLIGVLPVPIRSELRQHLHASGILEPVELTPENAARIIRPFGWLMDAVGTGGLKLSDAGWMPGPVVLDGMTQLGWTESWIGKSNRENLTPPIAKLREVAQRIGLVRVFKGRLVLTAAAKAALGDPVRQLRLVAGGLFRKLSDAETDAAVLQLLAIADGTPVDERWHTVAFGLEMCGWASSTGYGFTKTDIGHTTFHVDQVLRYIGEVSWRLGDESADVVTFAREALR